MPQIRETEIKKLFLPSYSDEPDENDRAWVKLETPARLPDFEAVNTEDSQIMQSASIIARKIKEWNLTDKDGNVLPVTAEAVYKFDAIDFTFLSVELGLDKLVRLSVQKKRISSST